MKLSKFDKLSRESNEIEIDQCDFESVHLICLCFRDLGHFLAV